MTAISHNLRLRERVSLTRAIEAAMDETLDREKVISLPVRTDAKESILPAHQELARGTAQRHLFRTAKHEKKTCRHPHFRAAQTNNTGGVENYKAMGTIDRTGHRSQAARRAPAGWEALQKQTASSGRRTYCAEIGSSGLWQSPSSLSSKSSLRVCRKNGDAKPKPATARSRLRLYRRKPRSRR